ncbi:tetratricopeptide repeat protein [Psychrobacter sp. JCM 18900]|uniref:tetratricopeptide repeat protein n=1 Tax=Psychrobacter sp. JCM 18900 TaxID=1298608 RepID=UPI001D104A5D|nr:tetratricopeptide repeat protein [Psychrobacter sp. JCM 18900]
MMVSSLRTTTSVKQTIMLWRNKITSSNTLLAGSAIIGMLSLSACQTAPSTSTTVQTTPVQTLPTSQPTVPSTTTTQAPVTEANDQSNYPTEPYNEVEQSEKPNPLTQETPVFTPPAPDVIQPDPVIIAPSRNDYIISEPSVPSHNELLEHARRNSQQRTQQAASNNSNLPAFRNLMQVGISQLKAGNLTNAESSFTRAQRLAPKSSAVYFYLAQVALKKNQPRKAEAMARRGLSVSQDSNRRRALWQVILQSGQAQGNSRVVNEAKKALR